MNFHPLKTQYFPTLTNSGIQAQEARAALPGGHLQSSHFTGLKGAGVREGWTSRGPTLGQLEHWLQLTRQQKGAHPNTYKIDLGNTTRGDQ